MDTARIEREVHLNATPDEVWAALTDQQVLSRWFGAQVEFDRSGARFTWPDGTARRAAIDVSEHARLLILRWLPFGHDAAGRTFPRPPAKIIFTLDDTGDGTLLRVVETAAEEHGRLAAPTLAEAR